jgi:membrane protein DedA with SNARE-associated domain
MLHWLHELLPHIPHYGYVLVFIVALLNNLGVPLPGETILLGAGFVLGKNADSLWPPVVAGAAACFLGGICAFWLGRRLGQGNLEKIRWLHLTPERLQWPEQFFKRHGAKTVFIARFIFLFPPVVANLLAGMSKMSWRTFLFYNLIGSAAYSITYILLGYFFGKQWKRLEAWLGPTTLYLIFAAIILILLGVLFRNALSSFWVRRFSKTRRQT